MLRCQFPEWRYHYNFTFENKSKISGREKYMCPQFWFGEENWYFDIVINDSSMSLHVVRQRSLRDVLLKSQVTVTDTMSNMTNSYLKQYQCEESWMVKIPYELAIVNEIYFKESIEEPNERFDVRIELVVYEIPLEKVRGLSEDNYETVLLKTEDKTEVQRYLSEVILNMYEKKIQTDIILNIQGEEIHAHRSILCARSPFFAKFFQDKTKSESNIVNIEDTNVDTMKKLVDYMYSRVNFNYGFDEAMDVYYAAEKYGLLQLREKCGKVILRKINESNAIHALLLADRHKDVSLKKAVMEMMKPTLKIYVKAEWWEGFARENSKLYKELINFL